MSQLALLQDAPIYLREPFFPSNGSREVVDLLKLQLPRFAEHIRLAHILVQIKRWDSWKAFLEHGASDLWFPFPKQILRHLLNDTASEKQFYRTQENLFDKDWNSSKHDVMPHFIYEDGEEVIESDRVLGEGGFGIVDQVRLPNIPRPIVCVRKRIARTKQFKGHKQIMEAFTREIKVMSQVDHQHCVRFLGSYTDHDTLAIFSHPVADMDMAVFLDLESLEGVPFTILYRGVGCLTSALLYLHQKKIRLVLFICWLTETVKQLCYPTVALSSDR